MNLYLFSANWNKLSIFLPKYFEMMASEESRSPSPKRGFSDRKWRNERGSDRKAGRLEETVTRAGLLGPDLRPELLLKSLGLILRTMRNEALGVGSASITSTWPLSEG